MSREQLAVCLAAAINLLNRLDDGNWPDEANACKRNILDSLPEAIDLQAQDHLYVSADALLNTPLNPRR